MITFRKKKKFLKLELKIANKLSISNLKCFQDKKKHFLLLLQSVEVLIIFSKNISLV